MSWRTVLISGRAKLDLKLNNLIVRKDEVTKIHIPEIAILIIDSTTISITTALIEKLIDSKVKIIFCGKDHSPIGEITNYYNRHNSVKIIKEQIKWTESNKGKVWAEIIKEKINNQARLLSYHDQNASKHLTLFMNQVEIGDSTNREGHAAKVYFNSLFGNDFIRNNDDPTNSMLNYGYSILLSVVNRELVCQGYLTQLGIFHDNQFNQYNLSSDLMEPFRPLVDSIVKYYEPIKFSKEEKFAILKMFDAQLKINDTNYTLLNGITVYVKSVIEAVTKGEIGLIKFAYYEL